MMKLITLLFSYIVVCLRLLSPGGVRAIAAENMVLRQQLITLSRNQKRAPRLTFFEKITFGLYVSMISAKRLARIAIILKPTTLLKFHQALVHRKYRLLFSKKSSRKPGPKGPRWSRYLVIDFSHPWLKSTRQRAKCLAPTVLRPARCAERASVCLPQ